jgi:hypothetical protein
LCLNFGFNALGLSAIDDKDVSIGEILKSVEQLNDCDNGTAACSNFGLFFDFSNFSSVTSDELVQYFPMQNDKNYIYEYQRHFGLSIVCC